VPDLRLAELMPAPRPGWSRILEIPAAPAPWERVLSLSAEPMFAEAQAALAEMLADPSTAPIAFQEYVEALPKTREEVLRAAMESLTKIEAVYTRKFDGSTGMYRLSPYEVGVHPESGRTVLWATVDDGTGAQPEGATHPGMPHDGTIHAFLYDRIGEVKPTAQTFAPLWRVQPESV